MYPSKIGSAIDINRYIVECKDHSGCNATIFDIHINRYIVECKDGTLWIATSGLSILIDT